MKKNKPTNTKNPHTIPNDISLKISLFTLISTLFIAFYHSSSYFFYLNNPTIYKHKDIVMQVIELLGSVAMSYFFITSAYLYFHNITSKSVYSKITSRIKSLLIPFLIWNLIYLVVSLIRLKSTQYFSMKDLILGFSFRPFNGPLWYIFALLILFIITSPINKIISL